MQKFLIIILLCFCLKVKAQELYVYTEPASNMPAKSLSFRLTGNFIGPQSYRANRMQRLSPELMIGINKKWMVHVGNTFSDMYSSNFRWESVYLYAKYRFLSNDEIHRHFRMAAFVDGSYSRNTFHHDEASLQGDKSGLQVGVIATQLWHKFALSSTVSNTQLLDESRKDRELFPSRVYDALNISLSGGYLLLPREYNDYRQTNVNIYTEILTQQSLDRKAYYIDLAPAVQFIFRSNTKINLGYRFELKGNMQRMSNSSFLVSYERTFLNAIGRKSR